MHNDLICFCPPKAHFTAGHMGSLSPSRALSQPCGKRGKISPRYRFCAHILALYPSPMLGLLRQRGIESLRGIIAMENSLLLGLKRGDCVHILGQRFNDVMLIESRMPETSNKLFGTLLSTGETVRLLIIKNHFGTLHLQRESGEVIHPDTLSIPLSEPEVMGWMLDQQRRLNKVASAAEAYASAFKRNCKSFQKKLDSSK